MYDVKIYKESPKEKVRYNETKETPKCCMRRGDLNTTWGEKSYTTLNVHFYEDFYDSKFNTIEALSL